MDLLFVGLLIAGCLALSLLQYLSDYKGIIYTVVIAILAVMLVVNNRWLLLPDIPAYLDNLYLIDLRSSLLNVYPNLYSFDSGFMTLTHIIKNVFNHEAVYLVVVYLIQFVCVFLSGRVLFQEHSIDNKKYRTVYYSALFISLWMGYFGLLYGMAVLRAGLSISLAFLGYAYFCKKAYVRSIVLFVIAFTMQAFIILLLFSFVLSIWYCRNRITYFYWFTGCITLWLSRLSFDIVSLINKASVIIAQYVPRFEKFSLFYNNVSESGFFSKKNLLYMVLAFLFILYKPDDNKKYDKLLHIYMIGLTVTCLTYPIVLCYRLSDMFLVFSVPLSYMLITSNEKLELNTRIIMTFALILVPFVISLRVLGLY